MVYTEEQLQQYKNEFITLLRSTNRPGIEELITWLETKSDFFTAPSSVQYHNNFKGGLVIHSLNVYKAAQKIIETISPLAIEEKQIKNLPEESIIISCLLHDLCKANFYHPIVKFWKDETRAYDQWRKYESYEIKDNFPLGHSEKSIIMAQNFIRLTAQEICAIRWHMLVGDPSLMQSPYTKQSVLQAINDVPLVMILIQADCFASFMMEREVNQKIENEVF